jgi:hypothetical protein
MNSIFSTDTVDAELRMHVKGNYWFYHKETFPSDFPLKYNELIKNVESYIEIIDPYFNVTGNNSDQDIFNDIPNDITLKILTFKGLNGNRTYLTAVENAIKSKIPSSKNVRFGMRVINKGDMNDKNYYFHDRFLIIDKRDVYLIGSSVGNHLTSQQSTGIYKVDDTNTKNFIQEIYNEYWKKAANNEIPLRYL